MRFLLLVLFLSLVNPTVGEAKPKKGKVVTVDKVRKFVLPKPLEIGRETSAMPFRAGDKQYQRLHGLGSIDTGGGTGRYIPSKPAKATKSKIRHKTKKTKKVPEVLGPNDKCFIPSGEDLTAAK